jgi:hypothetical protein
MQIHRNLDQGMRFEVLMAVKMSMLVFWAVTPYRFVSKKHTASIFRPKDKVSPYDVATQKTNTDSNRISNLLAEIQTWDLPDVIQTL